MTTNNAWNSPSLTSDGQLLIGDSSSPLRPAAATLTAGSNVTITNGNGSISIAAIGGGGSGFQVLNRQVFATSGTYTPTTGMVYCDIEVIGAGGGSGGCPATAGGGSPTQAGAGGGGGGGYARGIFSSTTIGASQTVTIGAGGTAGPSGNNPGSAGGTTSVGALISATGGGGGDGSPALGLNNGQAKAGGAGGVGTGGDFQTDGCAGGTSCVVGGVVALAGCGGSSFFGGGALSTLGAAAGLSFGGGASGSTAGGGSGPTAGAAGSPGGVIITEYIGTGATISNITYLTDTDSPYTVLLSDVFLSVDSSGGRVTLLFPDTPQPGQEWTVKDSTGSAAAHNITLTSVSGATLFDGATTYVIEANYEAVSLIGTNVPTYETYG